MLLAGELVSTTSKHSYFRLRNKSGTNVLEAWKSVYQLISVVYCMSVVSACLQISATLYCLCAGLMGLFEKRRFRSFLQFVQEHDPEDPKTWKGFDIKKQTMQECFDKHGLDAGTADFTGHALALYLNDEYVECRIH
jgi:hypothetical protein